MEAPPMLTRRQRVYTYTILAIWAAGILTAATHTAR